jgi:hypothetical protein
MNRSHEVLCLACCVVLAVVAQGCDGPVSSSRGPGAVIDPCAERLHEICGRLLLYRSSNGALPKTLADLQAPGAATPPPECPASGKAYVYNPEGLKVPGQVGRLVLYDPSPVHSRMRWGVVVGEGGMGQPLTATVVLLPDLPEFSAKK